MARVVWSEGALSDLDEIFDYIAKDSALYARSQVEDILYAAERLGEFPSLGRRLFEFSHMAYREIIVGGYRVIYKEIGRNLRIRIVAVVHGKRHLKLKNIR